MVLLAVATLGPRLRIDGRELFGLPWKVVGHIPLIKSALPGRLTMYIFLLLGVMTAAVLTAPELPRLAKYALALAIVIFMLPNPDYGFWTAPVDLPGFFANGIFSCVSAAGRHVVTIPYGDHSDCMLWQANSDFYFRMAGGYTGAVMLDDFLAVADRQLALLGWRHRRCHHSARGLPGVASCTRSDRAIALAVELAPILLALKDLSLRTNPDRRDGHLSDRADKIAEYRDLKPIVLEQRYDRDRFDRLPGRRRSLSFRRGRSARADSVARRDIGLDPAQMGRRSRHLHKDGLILGPWKNDRIQVGVVGSYDTLTPLIADYRADAAEVYFPFPHPLTGTPKGNTFMRKLVMVFEPAGLKRAAGARIIGVAADTMPRLPPLGRAAECLRSSFQTSMCRGGPVRHQVSPSGTHLRIHAGAPSHRMSRNLNATAQGSHLRTTRETLARSLQLSNSA